MGKPFTYPRLAPLIGGKVNLKDISSKWDEVLRLLSSIRLGTVTSIHPGITLFVASHKRMMPRGRPPASYGRMGFGLYEGAGPA